jgi:hypothetical protein
MDTEGGKNNFNKAGKLKRNLFSTSTCYKTNNKTALFATHREKHMFMPYFAICIVPSVNRL